ncbi:MAG: EF-P lysine aminoacylase GenX, partial [Hyphomonadaceae bacterium]|nr:EF-P lysine aminoacylase GenX [Hyphomonadaceae bacterium]
MTTSPYWEKARHTDRKPFLDARAAILRAVREWFWAQGFAEAEPNMVVPSPGAETHIEAFGADGGYLHTSPEFAMKRLLAAGEQKLFFLGKCWRKGESGPLHAPEFTMIEWYRAGAPYEAIMDDCIEIARVAARTAGTASFRWKDKSCDPFTAAERITVRDAFEELSPEPMPHDSDAFSAAIVQHVEPQLGDGALTLLTEYPIREAALARRCPHDASVAERFELYACGVELANGFGELTDPVEQRARLIEAMDEKQKRYGQRWPIDEDFLAALAHMPPAS